jgi:SAM-dependent methyltransferase
MSRAARRAWDDWARVDPLWAILTEPSAEHDEDAFFASGRDAIDMILAEASRVGHPSERKVALDFGCGVGRLTQALAAHFEVVHGLDISAVMIERAEELAVRRGVTNCWYRVHAADDLAQLDDASVDLVCSLLVLQHLPSTDAIHIYLREFVRVLAPGGIAVFQLPTHVPGGAADRPTRVGGLRQRATGALRKLGVDPRFLYRRLGWLPAMPMSALPESAVRSAITGADGAVVGCTPMEADHGGVRSALYYVTGAAR